MGEVVPVDRDAGGLLKNPLSELMAVPFDYVVTLCGHANETCPMFPGEAKIIHIGFDDSP